MRANRVIKIVAISGFAAIAVAILTIRNSPATSYEPSIYAATPSVVWGLLFFSIASGIGIAVHQAYRKEEDNNLWKVGLALIFLSNTILISLHALRGYPLWTGLGDPSSHLGYIQSLLATGHTDIARNFYPVTHIYMAQLSQIFSVDPLILARWIPVLFGVLSMVFMYFLAKSLLPRKSDVILATLAGTAFIHGWYLNATPNHLANLLFPLVLYLMVKSFIPATWQWKTLFILILCLLPAFHPVPAFALLAILLSLWLSNKVLFRSAAKTTEPDTSGFHFNATIGVLLFVLTITWLSSFYIWESTIRNIHTLAIEGGPTHISGVADQIARAQGYGYSIAEYFLKTYGPILLYIALALVALPILRKRIGSDMSFRRVSALYGPIAITAGAYAAFYGLYVSFGPGRLFIYIMLLSSILVGFTLSEFINRAARSGNWLAKATPFLICVLLLAVSVNGILKVYPSPYSNDANRQTTQTQIEGMDWFLHRRDTTELVSARRVSPFRFADLLLTQEERKEGYDVLVVPKELRPPPHFGYDKYSTLGQSYDENVYLVLGEEDRMLYQIFPNVTEYNISPSDFATLKNDSTVDKLYSNGGLDVWYVHATD